MQYSFKQIVYYNDSSAFNVPSGLTAANLNSKIFEATEGTPIYQLGIRALPGTKFTLNNSPNPVIIGFNGVFEINFLQSGSGSINSIQFDSTSLDLIRRNDSAYLIIDMVYPSGGGAGG